MKKGKVKRAFAAAFPHTIPVLTGFLLLGTAYGFLMASGGITVGWSLLTSALCFCGSMQFAAVPLFLGAHNPLHAFLLSLMVNARHLFYGVSMLKPYQGLGKVRAFLIFALCDETFSINCSVTPPETVDRKLFFFFITLLNYLYWLCGTALGGIAGGFITFNTAGLDFVLTALFVVVLLEQLRAPQNRRPAMLGIACGAVSVLLFGQGNMIIPAMLMIAAMLLGGKERLCLSPQTKG